MTLATFYRHFPSKQDLILAYLQRVHDDFDTRAAAAQAAAKDPGDVLKLIGHNITAQLLRTRLPRLCVHGRQRGLGVGGPGRPDHARRPHSPHLVP